MGLGAQGPMKPVRLDEVDGVDRTTGAGVAAEERATTEMTTPCHTERPFAEPPPGGTMDASGYSMSDTMGTAAARPDSEAGATPRPFPSPPPTWMDPPCAA